MKSTRGIFPVIAFWVIMSTSTFAARYYVKTTGKDTNSGVSWDAALKTIVKATEKAQEGDEVWVAKGTYAESKTVSNREDVALYGGFAGTESQLSERNISAHPTIIDGEDARQCVHNSGVLDGFHITRGIYGLGGGIYNNYGRVTNCTVYNNSATSYGGGIYNSSGTVTNCIVYNNSATSYGGGIYNDSSGTVTNCTVYNTSATSYGGGIYNYDSGALTNCTVYENKANYGGGIHNDEKGTVTNCTVYSNNAKYGGGGIYNKGTVTNCTVYNNSATDIVGGIYNKGTVTNCISWKNSLGDIWNRVSVKYSCFEEADGNDGNIRGNPLFVNTSGDLSTWDFRLQNGSPCVDTGSTKDAPETDIMGNPRPGADGKVCMGAYESPNEYEPQPPRALGPLYVSKSGNDANNGLSWKTALKTINAALNKIADSDDIYQIWVAEGTYAEGQTLIIPIRVTLYGGFAGTESQLSQRNISSHPTIIDGEDACRCVQNSGFLDGFHITRGKTENYGGGIYNTGTVTNCTIYGNKVLSQFGSGGGISNKYGTVTNCTVYGNNADVGGGIDSWQGTVTNCTVYGNSAVSDGGGIYNYGTVTNCTVYENSATKNGGGIDNSGTMTNCTVYNNTSTDIGGGIYNDEKGTVTDCTVYGNSAKYSGGGIYNYDSGTVTNCTVYENKADYGGGIYNYEKGTVTNCTIYGNRSSTHVIAKDFCGGGIYNKGTVTNCIVYNNNADDGGGISNYGTVTNCTIYGNSAKYSGGGIYNYDSGTVINCTVYGNNAKTRGGGIYNKGAVTNCTVYNNRAIDGGGIYNKGTVTNCIVWDNYTEDFKFSGGVVKYSCFSGGISGGGNISDNPMFVNVSGDDPTKWDLRLQPNSPCIDKGTSEGAPDYDILGVKRPQGSGYDMGAYEYIPSIPAIISHILGKKPFTPEEKNAADDNKDNIIDVADIIHIMKQK